MTTTEEINVSGEGFIERRVFVLPEEIHIEGLKAAAYKHGWIRGLLMGFAIFGVAAVCIWLALLGD